MEADSQAMIVRFGQKVGIGHEHLADEGPAVLFASSVVRCQRFKKKINPTRVPIEEKESIQWLDNLKQATTRLNEPEPCVHIGDRKATSTSFSAPRRKLEPISWYERVWIAWVEDGTRTISQEMDDA
jgi:hypothetical protein